jgi:hypothetical protein
MLLALVCNEVIAGCPANEWELTCVRKGSRWSRSGGVPSRPSMTIRQDLTSGRAMQIADGYHRVCASYYTDEDTDIPVKIAPAARL